MSLPNRKIKRDGRTNDLAFTWLTRTYGEDWEEWRKLAEEYMLKQDTSLNPKLQALVLFFETYLIGSVHYASDIKFFFEGFNGHRCSIEEYKKEILKNTNRSDNTQLTAALNNTVKFIDWVATEHFIKVDDKGLKTPIFNNPFKKVKFSGQISETVYNPLPYRYIMELRHMLCPKPRGHFSDWVWAIENSYRCATGGNWIDVDLDKIDKDDPDCVWRIYKRGNQKETVYQLWSPVAAMLLYIKLHLPLRMYQVRMLDSGEADEWRYESGNWVKNGKHSFVLKSRVKGVFRRYIDRLLNTESTGIYINTNKTADLNKNEIDHGYEIPWQNEDVLYWLEKLRNWQEKHNPITRPTDCTTLKSNHIRHKKSRASLASMGYICFLFRNVAARNTADKAKPIPEYQATGLWYRLLSQLEINLEKVGNTLLNGEPLKLVHDYGSNYRGNKKQTYFPLHSLRVSLITSYAIDAHVPLPVISKLLAGHSRLIMTIYYTKITPSVMKEKMDEAHRRIEENQQKSIRIFLKDASMQQIKCKTVYNDENAVEIALANRNPIGWEYRHHGLCLAGGNTVCSDETKTVCGCWNGGELIKGASDTKRRIHSAVAHGPENCIRCRWFITEARYLPALNAHLNFMSYKASELAKQAMKIEKNVSNLEDEKYEAEIEDKTFIKHNELQSLQRRYEKNLVEADEYTKDWIATFQIIRRIIEIEKKRDDDDNALKLVSTGNKDDIRVGFVETKSELLQLALICDDAELFPDLGDEIKKTSVIQDRTQALMRLMMKRGYLPPLLMMDKEQQLIAVNAMIRHMASMTDIDNRLEGFRKVTNYLEMEDFFENEDLLDKGIEALNKYSDKHAIKLTNGLLEIGDEDKSKK